MVQKANSPHLLLLVSSSSLFSHFIQNISHILHSLDNMRTSATAIGTVAAAALPAALGAPAYIPYAWNSSVPEIHNQPIAANNLAFWIGKPVTATCASWDPNCPSQNTTIISGPTGSTFDNAAFWMGILADGGQALYSDIPGRMQYSAVYTNNSASTTKPSYGEFYVEQDDNAGTVVRFGVRGTGHFVACAEAGAYRVWAWANGGWRSETGPCYEFEMSLDETTDAAVNYYD